MFPNLKSYSLNLLFDNTQITLKELKKQAEDVLVEHLPEIDFKINTTHSGTLLLTLKGKIEVIDKCHDKIYKKLVKDSELNCLRLLDEAGDEIRQKAYPILAEIEQRFRVFISQAIVEVCGFYWWDTLAPANMRDKVHSIREKHQEDGMLLDFLECTQFDDLITIITAEVAEWSENQVFTINEFLEIFNCDSFESAQNKLKSKFQRFSFWNVFSRYFQDKNKWDEVKKDINFVINIRHKVMHHRPIRLGTIKALLAKKTKIFTLLDSAKPELSVEELAEAKKDIEDIQKTVLVPTNLQLDAQLKAITEPLRRQNLQLDAQFKAITEPLRRQNLQLDAQLKAITEPLRRQNLQLDAQFKAITEPLRRQNLQLDAQFKAITEPLRRQNLQLDAQLKAITEPLRRQNLQLQAQIQQITELLPKPYSQISNGQENNLDLNSNQDENINIQSETSNLNAI
ncbi:MAG: hypothetical protein ACYT04_21275 [Nostoc sp.]